MASSEQRCVTDLLAEKLPVPLTERWLITAAQINLYYPPVPGKVRPKVVTVEVTRKGRLNSTPLCRRNLNAIWCR
jgi:hypothetical protein